MIIELVSHKRTPKSGEKLLESKDFLYIKGTPSGLLNTDSTSEFPMDVFRNMLVQEATTEILWSQRLVLIIHLHAIMMPTTCTEVLVSVFQEMVEYMRTKNFFFFFFFLVILHHDGIITP